MPDSRYPRWVRRLHWLVFALVAGALALIYLHGIAPKGSGLRANLKWAHMQFGAAALLVVLPRILVRLRSGKAPPITPAVPRWELAIGRFVHVVLYALLVATPVLGIANRMWNPADWNLVGIPMPHVAHPDRAFAHAIQELHETLGNALMYLAGFHATVALFHHFVLRNDNLRRLLPSAR